jgi:hypothetical protein
MLIKASSTGQQVGIWDLGFWNWNVGIWTRIGMLEFGPENGARNQNAILAKTRISEFAKNRIPEWGQKPA